METIKRYLLFVKPYWVFLFLAVFFGILKYIFPIIIPLVLQYSIDNILLSDSLSSDEKMNKVIVLMGIILLLFIIVRPIVEYYRQYFAFLSINSILRDLREKLFVHLQKLSLRFYSNRKTGELISRVVNDVQQTEAFVSTGLMNMWIDSIAILLVVVIMLKMNVTLTLICLSIFPVYVWAVKFFYGRLKKSTKKNSQALADLQAYLYEKLQGISVILSFSLERYELGKFNKRNKDLFKRNIEHGKRNSETFAAVNTIADIAPILVITYAAYQVINGDITIGTLVAFVSFMERVYTPLKRLVESSTRVTQSIASMERVFELLDEVYDIQDNDVKVSEDFVIRGNIKFENVFMKYEEKNSYILKNINLEVKVGETVALVGMSGGGKSTLINLIPRFYDSSKGNVIIDNENVKNIPLHTLRDNIGMVLQDNILFSESIKENIKMGNPNANDEEVEEAAKKAYAHDFIINLENGYDTEIGERGVKLSGGQKQRIALARVFLKNPSILIFDEATSALDLESEHFIKESLAVLSKNRTTIMIAHRLSTITHADKIVLMENGKIKEMGTHEELMNLKGDYCSLFELQKLE